MSLARLLVAGTLLCGAASAAQAQPFTDDELMVVKPEGMVDKASMSGKPPWCNGPFVGEKWERGRLRRAIGSRQNYELWADAAERLCDGANDPTWQKQAGYLVQEWMNARNLSQGDAEREIGEKIAKLKVERANEGKEPTDEERFKFSEHELTVYKPEDGAEVAKIGDKPAWCDKAVITDKWNSGRIGRTVGAKYGITGTIEGALHICQRPTDPTWKTEAGYILQKWMNWSHQTQAEAEASLRARIQIKEFAAQHDALCKALEYSPELGGPALAMAKAQNKFFGCGRDKQELWLDPSGTDESIGFYLDVATPAESELMRLYWLFDIVGTPYTEHGLPSKDASENLKLLYYAVAQNDFAHIDMPAIEKLLSAEPYNNLFARTVVMESVSVLKGRRRGFEQAVEKLTKGDEDYANILREAPKKALAQWEKATAQWKAEIARSDAFEKKLSSPSHKALKGCSVELQKDAEKLIKSFKLNTYQALVTKIAGDPVAVLLLSRLAVCDAADKVWGASGALQDLVKHGRDLRGPRSLMYYAIVDAIADAQKDRPRLLLSLNGFWHHGPSLIGIYSREFDFSGSAPSDPEKSYTKGVVAKVTKVADGLQITFKTQKITFPEQSCTDDTRHPLKVTSDGRIEYYRNCHNTGKMLSQDQTPQPITIAPALSAGVKPGAYIVGTDVANAGKGEVVYVKKSTNDKTIQTFFGFTL